MHQKVETWIHAMSAPATRRIVLRNLFFDLRYRRLTHDILAAFVDFLEKQWQESDGSPELAISDFATAATTPYCHGRPKPQPTEQCSRVMEAQTFWTVHVSKRRTGGTTEDRVSDDDLLLLERHGVTAPRQSEVRGGTRPFAWVTKTKELERLRTLPDFATRVRDMLGLLSYVRQERLVEVIYPREVSQSLRLAPPTFIEGTPEPVYRSIKGRDGWGRTVSLRGGKGLPEAVHEPVPFSSAFSIRWIGRPTHVHLELDWEHLAGDASFIPLLIAEIERKLHTPRKRKQAKGGHAR